MHIYIRFKILLFLSILIMVVPSDNKYINNNVVASEIQEYSTKQIYNNGKIYNVKIKTEYEDKFNGKTINNISYKSSKSREYNYL